jgi:hypothetical protein
VSLNPHRDRVEMSNSRSDVIFRDFLLLLLFLRRGEYRQRRDLGESENEGLKEGKSGRKGGATMKGNR